MDRAGFLSPSSPKEAACTAACVFCLMTHHGRYLEATVEVSLWPKRRGQGKGVEKRCNLLKQHVQRPQLEMRGNRRKTE